MPVSGNIPIIEATFRITWAPNQPNTPAVNSLSLTSTKWSITFKSRIINAANNANITTRPTNPNVSPIMAKTESLMASGK